MRLCPRASNRELRLALKGSVNDSLRRIHRRLEIPVVEPGLSRSADKTLRLAGGKEHFGGWYRIRTLESPSAEENTHRVDFPWLSKGDPDSNNGDHNIGAYLPSLLKTAGFHSIEAYTNDKASFTFPGSYDPSECEAIWEDARVIRETALAGGATEAEISAGLNALELLQALKVKQVADDQFAQSKPSVTLVVGARR